MVTTSKTNLRKAVSEYTGDYVSFAASADGNSAKTSIVANGLKNQPGGRDPGAFEAHYFRATNDSNSGETKHGESYFPDATEGATVLVQDSFTDTTASADTFEMHRIDPDLKDTAIDQALVELFPVLYLPIRDETLIVDSLLLNGDFEDWTSSEPDNWTDEGSATVTQETSIVFHGTSALKIVGPSGAVGRRYQDLNVNLDDAAGKSLLFKMWVHTDAASQARLVLNFGGSDTEGEYHDGDSDWQLLTVDAAIPTDATRARAIVEVIATKTAYADTGWAAVDPIYQYTVPNSIIRGPMRILQQYNENLPKGPYYPLLPGAGPTRGRILRLEGMGLLTRPSTETATTEIGEPHLRLVGAYAALKLVEVLGERSASEQIANLQRRKTNWERTVERLSNQPGLRMRKMPVERFEHTWSIGEDASGRYIDALAPRRGGTGFNT